MKNKNIDVAVCIILNEKEEILLQFLSRPRNIQFVGKAIVAEELTPNTIEYRKEKIKG